MVETLSMVYEFAEKLVQVNIKQEGAIKLLEEKLDRMERERRVEVAERDRRIRAEHRDMHHHRRDRRFNDCSIPGHAHFFLLSV